MRSCSLVWIDSREAVIVRWLDDRATEQALAALPTLTMSIAELQKEYPRPPAREVVRERAERREYRIERGRDDLPRGRASRGERRHGR